MAGISQDNALWLAAAAPVFLGLARLGRANRFLHAVSGSAALPGRAAPESARAARQHVCRPPAHPVFRSVETGHSASSRGLPTSMRRSPDAARGASTMVSTAPAAHGHVDSTTVLNMMRQDHAIRKPTIISYHGISEEQIDERMRTVSLYKSARMFEAFNKHEDCQLGRQEFAPLMQQMLPGISADEVDNIFSRVRGRSNYGARTVDFSQFDAWWRSEEGKELVARALHKRSMSRCMTEFRRRKADTPPWASDNEYKYRVRRARTRREAKAQAQATREEPPDECVASGLGGGATELPTAQQIAMWTSPPTSAPLGNRRNPIGPGNPPVGWGAGG